MRCSSYCVASEYNISDLVNHLKETGHEPKHFDDVIYVHKEFREQQTQQGQIDIFYFHFGCIAIWGANETQEREIIKEASNFEIKKIKQPIADFINCTYNKDIPKTFIDEEKNEMILNEDSTFIKLSISHALAQSVKLNVLEHSVSNIIEKAEPIQEELAQTGSISLSKNQISKQIGILFNERYSINLHSDILDTPEFFWRRPSYEPIYLMTAEFQDIQIRQNILNHRLNMIHELYTMLSQELNYKHSTRLEVIIIFLIAIEVILALSHHEIILNFLS